MFSRLFLRSSAFSVALFLIAIFCLYTGPIEEGDFFWHIKTGQWIWQHKALPSEDPFSYTAGGTNPIRPESQRARFILTQYWLGQLFLYGLWSAWGAKGIILARAFLYSAVLLFLYLWMRRLTEGILPAVLTFLTGIILLNFPSERPQLFTFVFTPILIFLLEKGLAAETAGAAPSGKRRFLAGHIRLLALPLLMLIWANTHGGFLLGVGLMAIYLAASLFSSITGRGRAWTQTAVLALSIAVTFLNPNGAMPAVEFFSTLPSYQGSIQENLSPLQAALKLRQFYPAYWIYLIFVAAFIIFRWRKMHVVHLLVLLSLAVLSLTGLRYMPYIFMASPLVVSYMREHRWVRFEGAVFLCVVVAWVFLADWGYAFRFREARMFPSGAVRFLASTKPAGQIFNEYNWGGYLMWHRPEYKVFIDGRGLVEEVASLYDSVLWGRRWEMLLGAYDVNTVIMPGMSRISGETFPLLDGLVKSRRWVLVYADDVSLVFVRDVPANAGVIRTYSSGKEAAYKHIVNMSDWLIRSNPRFAGYWVSRANAYYSLGNQKAAAGAIKEALSLDPSLGENLKEPASSRPQPPPH